VTALLQTIDLSCERDDRLLINALNLEIEPGVIYQLEGPNGSGKTTLLRVLCGLSTRYRGEILWGGETMARARADYLSQLLFIGHSAGVKAALTPRENLRWYAALTQADASTIEQALVQVGLRGFEDSPCFNLSAGQQRRVSLARLFLQQARLWVLDEPFTAIDKRGVAELEGWIEQHALQGGSVLLTTHHELNIEQAIRKISLGESS
jgi:heme exporter protein A